MIKRYNNPLVLFSPAEGSGGATSSGSASSGSASSGSASSGSASSGSASSDSASSDSASSDSASGDSASGDSASGDSFISSAFGLSAPLQKADLIGNADKADADKADADKADADKADADADADKADADKADADKADADKADADKADADKADADKVDADKVDADKADADADKADKADADKARTALAKKNPPDGYVPMPALHEARGENKYLKGEIAKLQAQLLDLTTSKTADSDTKTDDSPAVEKVEELSDEAFKALTEESPTEALLYMQKLHSYKESLLVKEVASVKSEAQQIVLDQEQRKINAELASANSAMENAIPGLFDENSDVQANLVQFAESVGFTQDLFFLTNPSTQVILPGETEPRYLGPLAVDVLTSLNKAQSLVKDNLSKTDTTPDKASIEAELRKTITAELTAKFKQSGGSAFTSMSDLPNTDSDTPATPQGVLSESEFAKLSPEKRDAYLMGAE